jgi:intracellular septation protein
MTQKTQLNPLLKLALDLGPLLLFFFAVIRPAAFAPLVAPILGADRIAGKQGEFLAATALFMVAIVIAMAISYLLIRRVPIMNIVSAAVVAIFGGLTILLHDETFFKMKPTIVYLLFAGLLFGGLLLRKPLLEIVFDQMFHLTEEGWHKLTIRWAVFFLAMAALNEIVWRNFSNEFWAGFKLFGALPLTFIFAMLQVPLMNRHAAPEQTDK